MVIKMISGQARKASNHVLQIYTVHMYSFLTRDFTLSPHLLRAPHETMVRRDTKAGHRYLTGPSKLAHACQVFHGAWHQTLPNGQSFFKGKVLGKGFRIKNKPPLAFAATVNQSLAGE